MWQVKKSRWAGLFAGVFWLLAQTILGVGAYPYPQKVQQPDGSVLTIRLHGDEWYNWVTTFDGYRVLKNRAGVYEYAAQLKSGKLAPSGRKASDPHIRPWHEVQFLSSTPKNLGVSRSDMLEQRRQMHTGMLKSSNMITFFPSSGEANLLVILANFSNTQATYGKNSFERFMNEPGFNGSGSFRDYYHEVSSGTLTLNATVTRWVQLPQTREYYSSVTKWSKFAHDAVKAAYEAGVDFSMFDNDGDGIVEGVAIIHQGAGQEVTGDPNDIWSHSFNFAAAGIPSVFRTFNGVVVNQYTVQPEWLNAAGEMNSIGVFCHEFGHNLGLPDFYDTTGGVQDGTGKWDMMAAGAYNGNPAGSTPAHHNPFSKSELGWADQIVINTPGTIQLEPVAASRQTLRVNAGNQNDYLLLENRQQTGFDSFIPGEGLLVYHADSIRIASRRNSNSINAYDDQGFYPLMAGGTLNDASCPFPGTLQVDVLTDYSEPAAQTHSGEPFGHSLTNIGMTAGKVHFDFMAIQDGAPLAIDATMMDSERIKVSWMPSENQYPILLAYSSGGVFGVPDDGTVYQPGEMLRGDGIVLYYGDDLDSFIHEGLLSATTYHYSVWSNKGSYYSQNITAVERTAPAPVLQFPWHDGFEQGFERWEQETYKGNNLWQILSEGTSGLPGEAFEGSNFAMLKINNWTAPVTRLITPVLTLQPGKSYFLDFRHVQPVWDGDQDVLRVMMRPVGGEWQELARYDANTTGWARRRVKIPLQEPLELAFEGESNYGYGIAIDDVVVYSESGCTSAPTVQSSNISASGVTESSMHLSWTGGSGDATLVVARKEQPVYELPGNGTSYTAGAVFGAGDDLGDQSFVVYSGTEEEFELSGLEHTTNYHFAFFEYTTGNLCYQYTPAVDTFSTRFRNYDIVFEVEDAGGNMLQGASVTLDGVEVFTSDEGAAAFRLEHSELYRAYHVSMAGFAPLSGRLIADGAQNLTITLDAFDGLPPSLLQAEKNDQTIELSWNPVINDDFENYRPFTTLLSGWTLEDRDRSDTYGLTGHTFPNEGEPMAFMVFDVYADEVLQVGYNSSARSGSGVLASFAAINGPNDDWIISPPFQVQSGDYLSFFARSLTVLYGPEVFNIRLKLQGEEEWQTLSQNQMVPESWTLFSYDLSDYIGQKLQLAVQCVSDDAFALFIDDLRVGPQVTGVPAPPAPFAPSAQEPQKAIREGSGDIKKTTLLKRGFDPAPLRLSGNVEYQLFKDGSLEAAIYGFDNVNYLDSPVGCDRSDYKVRVYYPGVEVYSPFSETVATTSCYQVLFKIMDNRGEPVSEASVIFHGETLTTNAAGEALFEGIEPGADKAYLVQKEGFDLLQGTLEVVDDMSVELVLSNSALSVESNWADEVTLSPNPAQNKMLLQGLPPVETRVEIYDMTGKKVTSIYPEGQSSIVINASAYPVGIYIIIITAPRQVARLKAVKN